MSDDLHRVESETVTFSFPSREFDVSTGTASGATHDAVTLEGSLTQLDGYDTAELWFEYRQTGSSSWSETGTETRVSAGGFDVEVGGLTPDTEYEFRARGYAETDDGENTADATGETGTFATLEGQFSVATGAVSDVTHNSATVAGELSELDDYDSADVYFEYRSTGDVGAEWTETDPETLTEPGTFDADLTDLEDGTEYEYRARGTVDHDGDEIDSVGDTATFTTDEVIEWESYTAGDGTDEESELFVYDADADGPTTVAINIHASERAGIDALEGMVSSWERPIESGRFVVWPAPCPSAEENETLTCNGEDLNSAFDLQDGPETTVAQTIEDELLEWDADYLVDLHSRATLYTDGGEGHAIFPVDDDVTRPAANEAVDAINAEYDFEPSEEWQVGNNIDDDSAENEGMLATYAWEIHDVYSQIAITWEPWNDTEQVDQLQRFVAVSLDESDHEIGADLEDLVS